MVYFHTGDYNNLTKVVINSIDPRISIKWPKFITEKSEHNNNSLMFVRQKFFRN
jgi:hypothetical protein